MAVSDPTDEHTPIPQLSNMAAAALENPDNPSNAPRGLTVPTTSTSLDLVHLHATTTSDVLSGLPSPPPFDLRVVNLTVGAPPPSQYLPLPIPIPIPKFLQNSVSGERSDTRPKTILQDVSAECHAGEMLAMYVLVQYV
jgi:hypothetical protein